MRTLVCNPCRQAVAEVPLLPLRRTGWSTRCRSISRHTGSRRQPKFGRQGKKPRLIPFDHRANEIDFRAGSVQVQSWAQRAAAEAAVRRRMSPDTNRKTDGQLTESHEALAAAVTATTSPRQARGRVTVWLEQELATFLSARGLPSDSAVLLRAGASLVGDDIFVSDSDYCVFHSPRCVRARWCVCVCVRVCACVCVCVYFSSRASRRSQHRLL
eukprot:SAG31_NODE_5737_length_2351_cov_1.333481_2_plen_214_part_00